MQRRWAAHARLLLLGVSLIVVTAIAQARTPAPSARVQPSPSVAKKPDGQDDSTNLKPAKDLQLRSDGELKAEALAMFVQGTALEENGEIDQALEAYRKVLNVDPGQAELASRVAALLTQQDDFPEAIDILKDAIKARPHAAEPYLQLAFIYAKYLKKTDQAIEYVNRAISLDPANVDAYQRLYEIELAAGDETKALQALRLVSGFSSGDFEVVFAVRAMIVLL
jgi:tetratricopeptide (TPR) repeat protein